MGTLTTGGRPSTPPASTRHPQGAPGLWVRAALLLSCVTMVTVESRRVAGSVLPLRAKAALLEQRTRAPGCRLGDRFYNLQDTWNPKLEPVGVMHCIFCQCQPVVKKGVLQPWGRVNCHNIKHDCPPVNCTEPELKPGQCCKLCQGQDPLIAQSLSLKQFPSFRFRSNIDLQLASAPKVVRRPTGSKEYLSLMVGAQAPTAARTSAVSRGHFTLKDAALHFSVHFVGSEEPRQLRILDGGGVVLFMFDVTETPAGGALMLCGVWRSLEQSEITKLNDGHLMAILSTADYEDGLVAGSIRSDRAIAKESFSAVLRPRSPTGSGGVAMVAIAGNGNVNFIIKMAGVLVPAGTARQVTVLFEKGSRTLHESTGELVGTDLEFAEVWTALSSRESRMLARGAVSITVVMPEGASLSGHVTVKRTCSVLHAVLSSGAALTSSLTSGSAGSALVALSSDGSLNYKVHLVGMQSRVTGLTFEMAPNKRGRTRRLCHVTSQLVRHRANFDGWANGTCDKLNSRLIHALLHGEIHVNVITRDVAVSALRGALATLLYNPEVDKARDPGLLLAGAALSPPTQTDLAGNAWVRLDDACALHYELVISGAAGREDAVLMAQLQLREAARDVPHQQAFTLQEFVGNTAGGTASSLPAPFYQYLSSGNVLLRVTTKAQPTGVIGAKLHIPNGCVVPSSQLNTFGILNDQEEPGARHQHRCVIGDVIYDDGDVWVPNKTDDRCITCHCKGNQGACHPAVCPDTDCATPLLLQGECCPQCISPGTSNRKCYFDGDKRWHGFGTRWHPYMPPFGYMTCAICTCTDGAHSGGVSCVRKACPILPCPESSAIRKHPSACCKACSEVQNKTSPHTQSNHGDVTITKSCSFHGHQYPDGVSWHPHIQPFGRLACVKCHCTRGATQCRRQRCLTLTCARKVIMQDECCPVCASGDTDIIYAHHRRRSRQRH